MSDLSEAIERAEKRLALMTDDKRQKFHIIVLQEELRRNIDKPASRLSPTGDGV